MVRQIPNLICLARIVLVWPIVAALRGANYDVAAALFTLAGVSDALDGYLAKRFNWTSELGKFLDPLADKLLLVVVFVSAAWLGLVPRWLTASVVARDVLIGLGALVFRMGFGPLEGRPTLLSKLNTLMQLAYLFFVMVHAAVGLPGLGALFALAVLTAATTVLSGCDYVVMFTRRALTFSARSP